MSLSIGPVAGQPMRQQKPLLKVLLSNQLFKEFKELDDRLKQTPPNRLMDEREIQNLETQINKLLADFDAFNRDCKSLTSLEKEGTWQNILHMEGIKRKFEGYLKDLDFYKTERKVRTTFGLSAPHSAVESIPQQYIKSGYIALKSWYIDVQGKMGQLYAGYVQPVLAYAEETVEDFLNTPYSMYDDPDVMFDPLPPVPPKRVFITGSNGRFAEVLDGGPLPVFYGPAPKPTTEERAPNATPFASNLPPQSNPKQAPLRKKGDAPEVITDLTGKRTAEVIDGDEYFPEERWVIPYNPSKIFENSTKQEENNASPQIFAKKQRSKTSEEEIELVSFAEAQTNSSGLEDLPSAPSSNQPQIIEKMEDTSRDKQISDPTPASEVKPLASHDTSPKILEQGKTRETVTQPKPPKKTAQFSEPDIFVFATEDEQKFSKLYSEEPKRDPKPNSGLLYGLFSLFSRKPTKIGTSGSVLTPQVPEPSVLAKPPLFEDEIANSLKEKSNDSGKTPLEASGLI